MCFIDSIERKFKVNAKKEDNEAKKIQRAKRERER